MGVIRGFDDIEVYPNNDGGISIVQHDVFRDEQVVLVPLHVVDELLRMIAEAVAESKG